MRDNTATWGGAVYNSGSGQVTLTNSSLTGNTAVHGAAVFTESAALTVTNSILTDNTAVLQGGGVYAAGEAAYATLNNSIIAENSAPLGSDVFVDAAALAGAHNLIGDGDGLENTTLFKTGSGNIIGTAAYPIPARLSDYVLALGTGQWGRFLLPESLAIDAGNNALAVDAGGNPLATDFWGNDRIGNGTVDIGAYEGSLDGPRLEAADARGPEGDDDSSALLFSVTLSEAMDYDVTVHYSTEDGTAIDGVDYVATSDWIVIQAGETTGVIAIPLLGNTEYEPDKDLAVNLLITTPTIAATATRIGTILNDDPIKVTTLDDVTDPDDGVISLREALVMLEDNLADRIVFAAALFDAGVGTLVLDGSELTIDQDVEIVGPGEDLLTIDADRQSRVLRLDAGVTASVSGVRLTGGAVGDAGGAIYNQGNLTLSHTIISNNLASAGGGIYNSYGSLMLFDAVLDGNAAGTGSGGGIYNLGGTVTIADTTFSANTAALSGGGVYNDHGTLTVTDSALEGNVANSNGGGIGNSNGDLTLTSTRFVRNVSTNNGGGLYNDSTAGVAIASSTFNGNLSGNDGGGFYNAAAEATVVNSAFVGNSAGEHGGAIYSDDALLLTNSTITHNEAGIGGGVFGSEMVTLNNTIVFQNQGGDEPNIDAAWSGVANLVGVAPGFVREPSPGADGSWGSRDDDYGDLHLSRNSFAMNLGSNQRAVDALGKPLATDIDGRLRINHEVVDIGAYEYLKIKPQEKETPSTVVTGLMDTINPLDGVITLREALHYSQIDSLGSEITFSSDLFAGKPGTIIMRRGEFQFRNDVAVRGPGSELLTLDINSEGRAFNVVGTETQVTLAGLTIRGGFGEEYGGAIYSRGMLELDDVAVVDNSASLGGGGIYNDGGSLIVTGSTIAGNSLEGGYLGGGIYNAGTISIVDSQLTANSAGYGGAVYNTGTLTIGDSQFGTNSAFNGGAVYNTSGTLTIDGVTFTENASNGDGGGAIYNVSGIVTVSDSSFDGNTAELVGGAVSNESGELSLTNVTFTRNSAVFLGGAVYNADGSVSLLSSSLNGNSAQDGGGVYNASGTLTIASSTLTGNLADDLQGTGGGLHNVAGTVTIVNSTLVENKARYGGAFYNRTDGFVTLDNSILLGNKAVNTAPEIFGDWFGGANLSGIDPLFAQDPDAGVDLSWGTEDDNYGDLRLLPSSIAINLGANTFSVDANGAPLEYDRAQLPRIVGSAVDVGAYEYQGTPEELEVPSNVVTSLADDVDYADGLYTLREAWIYATLGWVDPEISFDATLFDDGPAILQLARDEFLLHGDISITGPGPSLLTIDANHATRAFYVYPGVTAEISGLSIEQGRASDGGGAIANRGFLTLTDIDLTDNFANGELGGGAIYSDGELVLDNATLTDNTADVAGGGIHNAGVLTLTDADFHGNSAGSAGGAIHNLADATLVHVALFGNSAPTGGAISNAAGQLNLENVTFNGNSAGDGAAVYGDGGELSVTDSWFKGNHAANRGGAIYSSQGTLALRGAEFTRNTALYGGAVHTSGASPAAIFGSTFEGNTATQGGAIQSTNSLSVYNSVFGGNEASESGGAVHSGQALILTNATLAANAAQIGGAVYARSGEVQLYNTLIALNEAGISDPSIYGNWDAITSLVGFDPAFAANPNRGDDGEWGTDDDDYGDLQLTDTSIAVNHGSDFWTRKADLDGSEEDIAGQPRFHGYAVDLGAYEFQGEPSGNWETPSALVTSLADTIDFTDNKVTLREALVYTNFEFVDPVITFKPELFGGGAVEIVMEMGAFEIHDDISIVGPGAELLTVSANRAGRVFDVLSTTANVQLSGFTIADGRTAEHGAGVYNRGNLTLDGMEFAGNAATGSTSDGGGIYNQGVLTLTNTTFSDNSTTDQGGAICNAGDIATFTGVTIGGNTAKYGGGLFNSSDTVELVDSVLAANTATLDGAGIYSDNAALTLTNTEVSQNTAKRRGGGVYVAKGSLTLVNATLDDNFAYQDAGAIFSRNADLSLADSLLKGNSSASKGGAVYVDSGSAVFTSVNLEDNSSDLGGAVYASGGSISFASTSFLANQATRHGGAVYASGSAITLTDSTLNQNHAGNRGGAVYSDESDFTVFHTSFTTNSAGNSGGAIHANTGSTFTLTGSTLKGNTVNDAGGAIHSGGDLSLINSVLVGNEAANLGGGIYGSSGTLLLASTTVAGNAADRGGGIYIHAGTATLNNSIVALNDAAAQHPDVRGNRSENASLVGIDPQFVSRPDVGGDGVWGTSDDDYGDLALAGTSIAIDFGDNTLASDNDGTPLVEDINGSNRIAGPAIDAGAYEFQFGPTQREDLSNEVTSLDDVVDYGDGETTLQEAVIYATLGWVEPEITFSSTLIAGEHKTIDLPHGELLLRNSISITGPGEELLTIDGGDTNRVFYIVGNDVHLSGFSVSGGNTQGSGGAIYNNAGKLTLDHLTFSNNHAEEDGGAIHNDTGDLTLSNLSFTQNTAGGSGGALHVEGGELSLSATVFTGNQAGVDAGALHGSSQDATLSNVIFTGNSADRNGGAILHKGGSLALSEAEFSDNAAGDSGGAVHSSDGELTLLNAVFSDNAVGGDGGAIHASSTEAVISGASTFTGNTAARHGGAVFGHNGSFTLVGSSLEGNTAGNDGGAIYSSQETLILRDTEFTRNTALRGGAVYTTGTHDAVISGSQFNGNTATAGGAVDSSSPLHVANSVFSGNSATEDGGGIHNAGTLTLVNVTLAGNRAERGGGVYGESGSITLNNSLIALNQADVSGADIHGDWLGTANLVGFDPAFVGNPDPGQDTNWGTPDDDYGDLHLTDVSMATDLGSNKHALDAAGIPLPTDIDGLPRRFGDDVDVGAYELQAGPAGSREMLSTLVTSLADTVDSFDNVVTLREAVRYAEIDSLPPDISFEPDLFDGDLMPVTLELGEFLFRRSITITGPGSQFLSLDAHGAGRIFDIHGTNTVVELVGMTLTGGNAAGNGGAIYNRGTLSLTDVVVRGNLVTGGNDGAGIYHSGSSLTLIDSSVVDNSGGRRGGGIYNGGGNLVLDNSLVADNSATEYGGGIYGSGGTLSVFSSEVSDNTSGKHGGGIYTSGSNVLLSGTTFTVNAAAERGGGVYNAGGKITIDGTSLNGNRADRGGAVYHDSGTLAFVNSTSVGNVAGSYGGAIFTRGALTITNSTITANQAGQGGGVYREAGNTTINNSIVALNRADQLFPDVRGTWTGSANLVAIDPQFAQDPFQGADGDWGTPDDDYGDLSLADSSIAIDLGDNGLARDGARNDLLEDINGQERIVGTSVDIGAYEYQFQPGHRETPDNLVTRLGDVVDYGDDLVTLREAWAYAMLGWVEPELTFDASLFDDGQKTISLEQGEFLLRDDISITGPGEELLTLDAHGESRVFYVTDGSDVALSDFRVLGGYTLAQGGAVYSDGGSLSLSRLTFSQNTAESHGGAIYSLGGDASLADVTLLENLANGKGGGVYQSGGSLALVGMTFTRNRAQYDGGAIYNTGHASLTGTALEGNTANKGAGLYTSGTSRIANSTFVGNRAIERSQDAFDNEGGAIYCSGGTLDLAHATLAENEAQRGSAIYGQAGNITINNSIIVPDLADTLRPDVYGTWMGVANLIGPDPHFVVHPSKGGDGEWGTSDDQYGDLHLADTSIAIDLGANSAGIDSGDPRLASDFDGRPRPFGDVVDIGAYEFEGAPSEAREEPDNVVTSLEDKVDPLDGLVTLREAILYTQTDYIADEITFDADLFASCEKTIEMQLGEFAIRNDISVIGPGDDLLVIDAFEQSRIFNIFGGNTTVDLTGMALEAGRAADSQGGGIYNRGLLTLSDVTLSENLAQGSGAHGGGIYSTGTLSLAGVTLHANEADGHGGGIYSSGPLTISQSTITDNAAKGSGGGVFMKGTLTLSDSTLSGNSADGDGGGLYLYSGALTLTDTQFAENSAGGSGGGVYGRSGSLNLKNVTFDTNSAGAHGGAISNSGTSTVNDSEFSGNSAGGRGGAVNNQGSISLTNVNATRNSAQYGGGIYNGGTLTLTNSMVTQSYASNKAGGIYSHGATTLYNTTIAGNKSQNAGAGIHRTGGNLKLHNTIVARNTLNNGVMSDVQGAVHGNSEANLIGIATGTTGISDGSKQNQLGTFDFPINPMFVRDANWSDSIPGDFRLQSSSDAVDSGDISLVPEGCVFDIKGNPRIVGGSVDIGANERIGSAFRISLSRESDSGKYNNDRTTNVVSPKFDVYITALGQIQFDFDYDGVYDLAETITETGHYTFESNVAIPEGMRLVAAVAHPDSGYQMTDTARFRIDTTGPRLVFSPDSKQAPFYEIELTLDERYDAALLSEFSGSITLNDGTVVPVGATAGVGRVFSLHFPAIVAPRIRDSPDRRRNLRRGRQQGGADRVRVHSSGGRYSTLDRERLAEEAGIRRHRHRLCRFRRRDESRDARSRQLHDSLRGRHDASGGRRPSERRRPVRSYDYLRPAARRGRRIRVRGCDRRYGSGGQPNPRQ